MLLQIINKGLTFCTPRITMGRLLMLHPWDPSVDLRAPHRNFVIQGEILRFYLLLHLDPSVFPKSWAEEQSAEYVRPKSLDIQPLFNVGTAPSETAHPETRFVAPIDTVPVMTLSKAASSSRTNAAAGSSSTAPLGIFHVPDTNTVAILLEVPVGFNPGGAERNVVLTCQVRGTALQHSFWKTSSETETLDRILPSFQQQSPGDILPIRTVELPLRSVHPLAVALIPCPSPTSSLVGAQPRTSLNVLCVNTSEGRQGIPIRINALDLHSTDPSQAVVSSLFWPPSLTADPQALASPSWAAPGQPAALVLLPGLPQTLLPHDESAFLFMMHASPTLMAPAVGFLEGSAAAGAGSPPGSPPVGPLATGLAAPSAAGPQANSNVLANQQSIASALSYVPPLPPGDLLAYPDTNALDLLLGEGSPFAAPSPAHSPPYGGPSGAASGYPSAIGGPGAPLLTSLVGGAGGAVGGLGSSASSSLGMGVGPQGALTLSAASSMGLSGLTPASAASSAPALGPLAMPGGSPASPQSMGADSQLAIPNPPSDTTARSCRWHDSGWRVWVVGSAVPTLVRQLTIFDVVVTVTNRCAQPSDLTLLVGPPVLQLVPRPLSLSATIPAPADPSLLPPGLLDLVDSTPEWNLPPIPPSPDDQPAPISAPAPAPAQLPPKSSGPPLKNADTAAIPWGGVAASAPGPPASAAPEERLGAGAIVRPVSMGPVQCQTKFGGVSTTHPAMPSPSPVPSPALPLAVSPNIDPGATAGRPPSVVPSLGSAFSGPLLAGSSPMPPLARAPSAYPLPSAPAPAQLIGGRPPPPPPPGHPPVHVRHPSSLSLGSSSPAGLVARPPAPTGPPPPPPQLPANTPARPPVGHALPVARIPGLRTLMTAADAIQRSKERAAAAAASVGSAGPAPQMMGPPAVPKSAGLAGSAVPPPAPARSQPPPAPTPSPNGPGPALSPPSGAGPAAAASSARTGAPSRAPTSAPPASPDGSPAPEEVAPLSPMAPPSPAASVGGTATPSGDPGKPAGIAAPTAIRAAPGVSVSDADGLPSRAASAASIASASGGALTGGAPTPILILPAESAAPGSGTPLASPTMLADGGSAIDAASMPPSPGGTASPLRGDALLKDILEMNASGEADEPGNPEGRSPALMVKVESSPATLLDAERPAPDSSPAAPASASLLATSPDAPQAKVAGDEKATDALEATAPVSADPSSTVVAGYTAPASAAAPAPNKADGTPATLPTAPLEGVVLTPVPETPDHPRGSETGGASKDEECENQEDAPPGESCVRRRHHHHRHHTRGQLDDDDAPAPVRPAVDVAPAGEMVAEEKRRWAQMSPQSNYQQTVGTLVRDTWVQTHWSQPVECLQKAVHVGHLAQAGSSSVAIKFVATRSGLLPLGEFVIFDRRTGLYYRPSMQRHPLMVHVVGIPDVPSEDTPPI
ncbi:hypothetical protein PAPYR_1256 [Paratrimastix pyriformis]|uniref:Uncharacterized protein n=1 Tax=Paratrimastix pyriformis TaxID=342808 RepID=A0ABQ8UTB9_9EUKA|nr:hypothetical protein PAPYR_1256 [Paratrimastix pyriformis]